MQMLIDVTVEHKGKSQGQSPLKSQKRYIVGKTVSTAGLRHGTQILLPIDDSCKISKRASRASTQSRHPNITEIIREAQVLGQRRRSSSKGSHARKSANRSLRVSIDMNSRH